MLFGLCFSFNPFYPNIRMHILRTVLCHFLRCLQGEFVEQSSATLVGDYFHYSHDLGV